MFVHSLLVVISSYLEAFVCTKLLVCIQFLHPPPNCVPAGLLATIVGTLMASCAVPSSYPPQAYFCCLPNLFHQVFHSSLTLGWSHAGRTRGICAEPARKLWRSCGETACCTERCSKGDAWGFLGLDSAPFIHPHPPAIQRGT